MKLSEIRKVRFRNFHRIKIVTMEGMMALKLAPAAWLRNMIGLMATLLTIFRVRRKIL